MTTTRWVTACALVAALGVAGCGSDDNYDSGGGGTGGAPKATTGFDGKTIKLGVITPLSGPVAVIGLPLTAGNQAWFSKINDEGGIAGKYKVRLVERDSRYDAPTAVQDYNGLKNQFAAFGQILGSAIRLAFLPQLKSDKIAAAPATLDSAWVRQPNLMPVLAPYQVQAANGLFYYTRTEGKGGGKRICGVFQDDGYGEAGHQGLTDAAKSLGLKLSADLKYRVGDKDFTGQVTQLKNAKCDMVWVTGLPTETGALLGTAAQAKFAPRWIGQSPTWVEALAKSPLKPYLEARYWLVSEGAAWGDTDVKGMAELMAAKDALPQKTKVADGDLYFSFGYQQARAVTALLEKAVENGDLSHEGIVKAIQQVGTISFDDVVGDYKYGPIDERDPSRKSSIFAIDAKSPYGLKALKTNFSGAPAKELKF
jgi:ABC-type branched-subunit amino acid transport system substrate-binding protein